MQYYCTVVCCTYMYMYMMKWMDGRVLLPKPHSMYHKYIVVKNTVLISVAYDRRKTHATVDVLLQESCLNSYNELFTLKKLLKTWTVNNKIASTTRPNKTETVNIKISSIPRRNKTGTVNIKISSITRRSKKRNC